MWLPGNQQFKWWGLQTQIIMFLEFDKVVIREHERILRFKAKCVEECKQQQVEHEQK